MSNSLNKQGDIDIFDLLEVIWRQRIIIITITLFFSVSTIFYFWFSTKIFYEVRSVATVFGLSSLRQYEIGSRLSSLNELTAKKMPRVLGVDFYSWLDRIAYEITNPVIHQETISWAKNNRPESLNWLTETRNYSDYEIQQQILSRLSANKQDNNLHIIFKTDRPNSGALFLDFLVKKAHQQAYERLESDYIATLSTHIDNTSIQLAEAWTLIAFLEELPPKSLPDYDSEDLEDAQEILASVAKSLKTLSEIHLARAHKKPNTKLDEISSVLPSITSDEPVTSFLDKKREMATATLLGFLFSVFLVLIINGFEQRRNLPAIETNDRV